MSWAEEFADFPAADMPEIPALFEDCSWHNDLCPSFINEAAGVILSIDYANPAQREFPESPRYFVTVWDVGNTGLLVVDGDDWSEILAGLIGLWFAGRLRLEIGPEAFGEMRQRNAEPFFQRETACASHDYCDANTIAAEAYRDVMGRALDLDSDHEVALFNAAWDFAKRRWLTATPTQEPRP